jgi:hypothetical protein
VRSPFHSEQEAFRFILLLLLAAIPVALAAAFGPAWLVIVVLAVVLGVLVARLAQLRLRKLQGLELPLKMAPPHLGSPSERRVLLVANETLAEGSLLGELERLASSPETRLLLLVPALITPAARLTGGVDDVLGEARARLRAALERVGREQTVTGQVSAADPLEAIEDAFATFSPDEVIVATGWERAPGGLEPSLAWLVRERFAVPVRHLVCEPGAGLREPDRETEARYRRESGQAAGRSFILRSLAGAGIVAAVVMSAAALVRSGEKSEAHAVAQAAAEEVAGLPPVAKEVSLKVIPEWKPGPEGEKHDAFTTTEFSLRVGQPLKLDIDNTDTVPHSITAPAAGINIVVMPGTHVYTLVVNHTGRFLWFCTFVCDEWAMEHPGYMSGYITVS